MVTDVRSRAGLGFTCLAIVAVVLAMLTAGTGVASAAVDPCSGQLSIAISGPNGASSTQPLGSDVQLTVLAGDHVMPDVCSLGPVSVGWRAIPDLQRSNPSSDFFSSGTGNPVSAHDVLPYQLTSDGDGVTYEATVAVLNKFGDLQPLPGGFPKVSISWVDAGPSGSSFVTSPGVPVIRQLVAMTAHTNSPAGVDTYIWNFGDGSSLSSPTPTVDHIYTGSGDFQVQLTVRDPYWRTVAPQDQVVQTVHVSAAPLAPLVAAFTGPQSVVLGGRARFDGTGSSTDDQAPISGYAWDFGDGLHGTGPLVTHLFASTGTYRVAETVTDASGRTATSGEDVTVTEPSDVGGSTSPTDVPPVAAFTSAPAQPVAGSRVSFDGSGSSDSDGLIVGYSWSFGGGATDSAVNPTHVFAHAGDYPVTLTVTDDQGQTNSSTQTVHVTQASPTAAFAAPTNAIAGSPLPFDGSGSGDPDGSVSSWSWDFGDSTPAGTGSTLSHTYQHAGSYDVTLTVTDNDGNTDSATHPVTIGRGGPAAVFAAPTTAVVAAPTSFDGSASSDADGTITDWSWDFGDGTPVHGQSASHTFPHAGSYPVTLTVTDDAGLSSSVSHDVRVAGAAPTAVFTAPTASSNTPVTFDGTTSSDPDGSVTGYHWQFGDGTPDADGATPAHSFPAAGSYPVTLTVTDDSGLTGQVTHLVAVGTALPTATFTGPSTATASQTLTFDGSGSTDPSGPITSWNWTFGDGKSATGATPTHAFATPGTYSIALTVADAAGRIATVIHPVTVRWPATDLAVATSGATPKAGQYTYTITVKNLGKAAAHSVRLLATLDPTQVLAAKPVAPAGLTCDGVPVGATGTVTCKASTATLAPGKSWVVKLTVKQPTAPKVAAVTEISKVDAANPDPVSANDVARMTTTLAVKR